MNIPRRLFLPEETLPHSCYQVITFQAHGMPCIYQFKTSQEAAEFVVLHNTGDYKPIIQYIAPLDVPIPEMDMPPRLQDLNPLTVAMPDSPEDAQKLKAYLDGEMPS